MIPTPMKNNLGSWMVPSPSPRPSPVGRGRIVCSRRRSHHPKSLPTWLRRSPAPWGGGRGEGNRDIRTAWGNSLTEDGTIPHSALRTPHSQSGIALVIVMISVFVLTILAAGFAFSMKVETKLAMHANNETELQWLGRSGVEYARWVVFLQGACPMEPYDAL